MKTLMLVLCMSLVIHVVACGEDTPAAREDKGPSSVDMAVKVDQGAPDTSKPQPDQGVPDKAVTQPDLAIPQPLTNTHEGWQTAACAGNDCHSLPISEGTHLNTTAIADCAGCHGGNGAYNPNGPKSGKKDHNAGSSCTMCHQSEHSAGYSSNDCRACHYAAAGVVDRL